MYMHVIRLACFSLRPDGEPNDPIFCAMMPRYRSVTDDAGCKTDLLQTNVCSGGCGKITGYCCEPEHTTYHRRQFVCPDRTVNYAKVRARAHPRTHARTHKPLPGVFSARIFLKAVDASRIKLCWIGGYRFCHQVARVQRCRCVPGSTAVKTPLIIPV